MARGMMVVGLTMLVVTALCVPDIAFAQFNITQKTKVVPSTPGVAGTSVAIDGDTAIVGAPAERVGANLTQGTAYIYVRNGATWVQQARLTAFDGESGDQFGSGVAIRGDIALVGAVSWTNPNNGNSPGAVYVFTRIGTTWSFASRLIATPAEAGVSDAFGASVAFDGQTAIVGAPAHDGFAGAAWLFFVTSADGSAWDAGPKLIASDHTAGYGFGISVAVRGEVAVIGADTTAGNGAAYIFTKQGPAWLQVQKLTASPIVTNGAFGRGVAIEGQFNMVLIGSPCDGGGCQGGVYVFTKNFGTGQWDQRGRMTAPDGFSGDNFGISVALYDAGYAAIGATRTGANGGGSTYVYNVSGDTWFYMATLRPADAAGSDRFGSSVAIKWTQSDLSVIAGAPFKSATAGAAYIFSATAPHLQTLPNVSTPEDTPLQIPFTVSDDESSADTLDLFAFAIEPGGGHTLLPASGLQIAGSGTTRTLIVPPNANQSGLATIVIGANDETFISSQIQFQFTVTPVNDAPAIGPIANQTTGQGAPTAAIPFTIDDIDTPIAQLTVSATSSNTIVVPSNNITFGGSNAARTITIAPAADQHGTSTITVTVSDGALQATRSFVLTVEPPPPPPPDPARTYFLAEGSTGAFFDMDLLLANPNGTDAPITITFFKEDGSTVVQNRTLPALSRTTIRVDEIAGLEATALSTSVTSPTGVPLIVERTMWWDKSGYGAHGEKAVEGTATRWYFAEGSQGFFSTFFLLVNPGTTANIAHVTYLREFEPPFTRDYPMAPTSRHTIDAATEPDLINRSFGAIITFDQPGVAERAMYFGRNPLWTGGHDSVGATSLSNTWFLAEGATGTFFNTFVLMANPNVDATTATVTYLPATGTPITRDYPIAGGQRLTINIATEDPSLVSAAVSTRVEATRPIVVERSQYWPAPNWYEAHNSFGVTATGTRWGLAEGRVGGATGAQTFILLANPGTNTATVTVRFLRANGGAPLVKTFTVEPTRRFNIAIINDASSDVPELVDEAFGAVIESTEPVAVERAMYANDTHGTIWAAGTCATGTPLP